MGKVLDTLVHWSGQAPERNWQHKDASLPVRMLTDKVLIVQKLSLKQHGVLMSLPMAMGWAYLNQHQQYS
eukprot:1913316-Amphidinium_carterae.1